MPGDFVQVICSFKKEDIVKLDELASKVGVSRSQLVRNLTLDNIQDSSFLLKFAGPFLFLGSKK